jgi:hypothetical protein
MEKFLLPGETFIPPDELKERSKDHYFNQMFYRRLCDMVEKVLRMQELGPLELE